MKRKLKKKIFNALATTCAITVLSSISITRVTNAEVRTEEKINEVKVGIYPVPQRIEYLSKDGMTLEGEVNVVIHGNQEKATITKLKEILEKNNIKYSTSEKLMDEKANIIISSDKNHCDDCTKENLVENDLLNKKEGYILKSSNDKNTKGNILIIGSDEDGVYYGVLTLDQILGQSTNDGKFSEVIITDYPEIEFRGFVEGFYGTPWSHQDRINLMKDTSKFKMNTYIYAPKDDLYHRRDWKELYPEDKAREIAELAKVGKDNNFNFCWTIHPGATLKFTNEDYKAVIRKFEQLYSLGVRQFGVLFDDTDDWSNGGKQAEWINKIDTEFVKAKGDIAPMIVISARYNSAWGPNIQRYFKPFMQTLHSDIQVMWTGHATMSNVSRDVFEWPKTQTGVNKDVAVWWNYPVNDYCDSRILMAPLHNLNKDLNNVSGFFSNPMNQAEASKVALYSIADYTWNTDAFDYMKSWEVSIEKLVPEVKEEFMRFASNTCYLKDDGGASGPFEYDESWYLKEKIDTLKKAITNKEGVIEAAENLLVEFNRMLSDYENITTKVTNDKLLNELSQFLSSYKALSEAGINSMEALISAENGQIEDWLSKNSEAKSKLDLMDKFKVERLEDENGKAVTKEYVVSVGTKRLKQLIQESIGASQSIISDSLLVKYEPKVISSIESLLNSTVEASEGNYLLKDISNVNLDKDDYIGIALPKVMKLSGVELNADNYEGLDIEYSLNGIEWSKLEAKTVDGELKFNSNIQATFIRILSSSNNPITINIKSLKAKPIYKANPKITQNIGTYQNYVIENVLDGNMDTKYWSDKASGNGHYIQIDLGNNIPIYDISAYFNGNDYMRNSEFMISKDGLLWTSLGALKYTEKDGKKVASVNGQGEMARYIKIQANGENNGCWVQLCELQFNKTVPELGDDTVELVTGTPEGKWSYLYDGDLTTAFEPKSIKDGDAITYKMSRVTNVLELSFLQDADKICDATVSIKDLKGNWNDIGKLDKQLSTLKVEKGILEVKITFNSSKPTPKIYEIIAKEGEVVEVEKFKRHLEIAVSEAKKIQDEDLDKVIPIVVKEFKEALDEAEKVLLNSNSTQKEIDDSFKKLSDVMHMLSFEKGDKSNLINLLEQINTLNSDEYIKDTWDKLQVALNEANEVIAEENAMEKEVAESYENLIKAFLDLRLKPSKDKLEKLIKDVEDMDKSKYTVGTWTALEKELLSAKKVMENENATIEEIEDSEKAITSAVNSLVTLDTENNNNDSSDNNGGTNNSVESNNNSSSNNVTNNNDVTTDPSNSNLNNINNELPKTGVENLGYIQGLGTILFSLGVILLLKKKTKI